MNLEVGRQASQEPSYIRKGSYEDELKNNSSSEREEEVSSMGAGSHSTTPTVHLPTESQLVLLCLDYLRDLRRAYEGVDLQEAEGINPDYLSVAIYALSRCFMSPEFLTHEYRGNDAFFDRDNNNNNNNNKSSGSDNTNENKENANDPHHANPSTAANSPASGNSNTNNGGNNLLTILTPMMDLINKDILYSQNPFLDNGEGGEQKKEPDEDDENPYSWYEYDDSHPSNAYRFYSLNGLASGPTLRGPLTLGEITVSGLSNLSARSRIDAERDMVKSPLFDQFVLAVKAKNFFYDPDNENPRSDPHEETLRLQRKQRVYEERYRKVVAKFRTKLATKAEATNQQNNTMQGHAGKPPTGPHANHSTNTNSTTYLLSLTAADRQRKRREMNIEDARYKRVSHDANNHGPPGGMPRSNLPPRGAASAIGKPAYYQEQQQLHHHHQLQMQQHQQPQHHQQQQRPQIVTDTPPPATDTSHNEYSALADGTSSLTSPRSTISQDNPMDIEEAERLKSEGNSFMQRKEYQHAINSYTHALKLSPTGPNSHVYFSNRAAALLSIKRFSDAILDSERALALKPDYGKAHARLGLAHFLMGNYRQAMEAYTVSLKYDPDNKSSQNYLEKAAKRVAAADANNNNNSANNGAGASGGGGTSGQNNGSAMGAKGNHGDRGLENPGVINSSFSLVSEWDKSNNNNNSGGAGGGTRTAKSAPIATPSPANSNHASGSSNINNNNIQVVVGAGGNAATNDNHQNENEQGVESILSPSSLTQTTATTPLEDKQKRLMDQREAEKYKAKGNSYMASREYKLALEAYSHAISLSSNGPHSHVYFSNRAAALCYLERYKEAEADSESSLRLNPTYGKAHARLGLSRFFLKDYKGAVQAYTSALEYDPDNAASKSYLAKAVSKLESQQGNNRQRRTASNSPTQQRYPASPGRVGGGGGGGGAPGSNIPPPSASAVPATGADGAPVPEFLNVARKMAQSRRT